ncbi:GNAT family N-acetyltransferase [Rasiella rasia]|uniref:GNAT family N-acetyltransferase n=1 Tax=Rasiella rasia TaxID=2744027 RepID=A0A6G6GJQ8_9FLAO|nr:GNAT family N-acetyltransferase [Rasiella rasia]QIE58778.1 GNAT family N-acetyltransferase [Rasiella rasia]
MTPIETERLLLRKIKVADAPFFYELFNSEGWLKYIGDRNIRVVADAEKQIVEKYIPSYKNNGYGSYLVIEKASGCPVGTCGMYKRPNLDHPDIGFAFLPAYYKKGYGYESAAAILSKTTKELKLKKVVAFTLPENTASIKLLEKLGLTNVGVYQYQDDPEELLLFST